MSAHVLWCIAVVAWVGAAAAADEVAQSPRKPDAELELFEGWASSWSWNQGLHYGIDVPDLPETWDAGELRWRPLLRGSLGLRLAVDTAGLRQGGRFVELDRDVGLRRAYVYVDGTVAGLWKPLSYKFELGAVDDEFSLRNASIAVHELPYAGTFKVGSFDAPMSLAMLTSSRATSLMELGLAVEAFAPGTLTGFSFANHLAPQRLTWSLGLFSEGRDADVGDESEAPLRAVGRLTWLPWRTPQEFLHVGLSGSWAYSPDERIRFQSRPESFFAPLIADTGDIDAPQSIVIGLETAWVRDRLSLGCEYLQATVLRDGAGDAFFGGLYLVGSWFLTPDSRIYSDSEAVFTAIVPTRPLSWSARQIGAIELALRWSYLDLTDGDVRGGRASGLTSGLNWYWNRYVRLQFNVGWSHADGGPRPGDAAVLQARFDLMI